MRLILRRRQLSDPLEHGEFLVNSSFLAIIVRRAELSTPNRLVCVDRCEQLLNIPGGELLHTGKKREERKTSIKFNDAIKDELNRDYRLQIIDVSIVIVHGRYNKEIWNNSSISSAICYRLCSLPLKWRRKVVRTHIRRRFKLLFGTLQSIPRPNIGYIAERQRRRWIRLFMIF